MLHLILISLLWLLTLTASFAIPNAQDVFTKVDSTDVEKRPLRFGDLNFLHTTDTHGWLAGHQNQPSYNADWGDFYSFAEHLRAIAKANSQDLIIVDSGDRHDGNGLSDATVPNGLYSSPIFALQEYDIVSIGNHELYLWENTQQELDIMVPALTDRYVCSNVEFYRDGKYFPIGQKYRYFKTPIQKKRILAFSFLFDFNRANPNTKVIPIETAITETWFQSILSHFPQNEVDVIVVAGHLPVDKNWSEMQLLHSALRAHYPDIPIQYFGGHSHIRDFTVLDEQLTGLQSGRFCETLGFLSLNTTKSHLELKDRFFRSYIDFDINLFRFHTNIKKNEVFDTEKGLAIKKELQNARSILNLDSVIGNVTKSNYYMDYVPLTHKSNIYNLLINKVLPTLKPDSNLTEVNEQRIIIINTGSVRYDLYKGPYTVDTHYIVSPFQNDWVKLTLPKSVALKIPPVLNKRSYILGPHAYSDLHLLPPHQRNLDYQSQSDLDFKFGALENHPAEPFSSKLKKGYVTYDDFGNDGDDTPHKAVKSYRLTNVVVSEQLSSLDEDEMIDVIFYAFLTSNVKAAIQTLGYTVQDPDLYSRKYLGLLLDEFAATNGL